jgi:predicted SnoaL-like aldol condensation-catalyzing enzyme
MSSEENIAALRRIILEGFGDGDVSVIDQLAAPNLKEHQFGVFPPNAEGVKKAIAGLHASFSEMRYTIEHVTADGNMVWMHAKARGKHTGQLGALPPTGKSVEIDVIDIARFEDGKIVEHWGVPDRFGMLQQLGALPQPTK